MPKPVITTQVRGDDDHITAEILVDGVAYAGIVCDAGVDTDPTAVIWRQDGDTHYMVPVAELKEG